MFVTAKVDLVGGTTTVAPRTLVVSHLMTVARFRSGSLALEPSLHESAKAEFDLLDEPEPWPKTSLSTAAVLVRSLEYGPGVAPPNDDAGRRNKVNVDVVDLETLETAHAKLDIMKCLVGVEHEHDE